MEALKASKDESQNDDLHILILNGNLRINDSEMINFYIKNL